MRISGSRLAVSLAAGLAAALVAALPLAHRNAHGRTVGETRGKTDLLASLVGARLGSAALQQVLSGTGASRVAAALRSAGFAEARLLGPDGSIRFAAAGTPERDGPRIAAALAGRTVDAHVTVGGRQMLEVVAPVRRDGQVVGALETFRDWSPVAAEIRSDVVERVLTVLAGMTALLLALAPFAWRLLQRHRREAATRIHELEGAERSAHDAADRLAAIVAAQREIAELDLGAGLARLAERVQELVGADGAWVYRHNGDRLEPLATSSMLKGIGRVPTLPLDGSLAGLAFRTGEVQTSNDAGADARVHRASDVDVGAIIGVPIGTAGEEPLGVLTVVYRQPGTVAPESVETVRLIAQAVGATLRTASELEVKQHLVAALAASEERFRNAIESSPVGFALCTPDDRYTIVNDAFCRLTGRTREELASLTWRDVTHPEDLPQDEELSRALFAGTIPHIELEKRIVRPGGEVVWAHMLVSLVCNENGSPAYGLAQLTDVTERRRLEDSVHERERLFRAVFDQSIIAHILFDDEGRILDANERAEALAELPRAELVGRSWVEFAAPGEDFPAILAELLERGQAEGEADILTATGARRTVLFSARAHVRPGLHLSVIQDVTEQRALEDRLRQGQKMEAVGRLAGGIAHDFNNMLTAINGYSELLIGKLGEDDPLHRQAFQIHHAGQRAAALTRQLLAFSRRQVLQPSVLDLNAAIAETRDMIQRLVGEDVAVETRLDPAAEPVLADETQVQQVLVNLAANARDAMPQGGVLAVETASVTVDPEQAREAVATPGRYTRIRIADTGMGMDDHQLAQVFEPFYSTKGDAGVGLGLATVYGIVRQSGGFITVSSAAGRGSTFDVYLPVTALRGEPDEAAADPDAGAAGVGTVLLVEDEEVVRSIVTEMLEQGGYRVLAAADGSEAVRIAQTEPGTIDALVTDVVMPGMSGQEAARLVAEEKPGIRTLFVSGYNESAIQHHGVLAPGTTFLQKPFTSADLTATLRELLEPAPVASAG
jgi:two-component system cell cycle sensor histidine kinase/response regulator CckA